jgi:hypothetical protein
VLTNDEHMRTEACARDDRIRTNSHRVEVGVAQTVFDELQCHIALGPVIERSAALQTSSASIMIAYACGHLPARRHTAIAP